jgi:hypothetical protein
MKPNNKALWQAYEDGRHDERVDLKFVIDRMIEEEISTLHKPGTSVSRLLDLLIKISKV